MKDLILAVFFTVLSLVIFRYRKFGITDIGESYRFTRKMKLLRQWVLIISMAIFAIYTYVKFLLYVF